MELSFKELKKREVINVADGKSLGNITDLTLDFPKGVLTGIIVPGKKLNCITKLFNRTEIYISQSKIIKIGNDVILVDLKCGELCAESVTLTKYGAKNNPCCNDKPPKPPSDCINIDLNDY